VDVRADVCVSPDVLVACYVQRRGHPFCQHGPDVLSNRVEALAIGVAGIGLGALECVAYARLRSIDEGDDHVMESPTTGDPSRGGYKNRPAGPSFRMRRTGTQLGQSVGLLTGEEVAGSQRSWSFPPRLCLRPLRLALGACCGC
jgi:hypothetical protein